jgi:hypothetical protein
MSKSYISVELRQKVAKQANASAQGLTVLEDINFSSSTFVKKNLQKISPFVTSTCYHKTSMDD